MIKFKRFWNVNLTGWRKLRSKLGSKDMRTYREEEEESDKMEQRVRSREIFAILLHFAVINLTLRKFRITLL